jgi:hypothetical protein
VSIIKHYLTSKSFAAVREVLSNAFLEKEEPNKITIHLLETKVLATGSVCDKSSSRDERAEVSAVPIPSSASTATMGYF